MELDKNVAATIDTVISNLVGIRETIGIRSESSTKIEITDVIRNLRIAAELLNNIGKTDEACTLKVLSIMKT